MPDALIAAAAQLEPEAELLLSGDHDFAGLSGFNCEVRLLGSS
jgi:hypothetical protein